MCVDENVGTRLKTEPIRRLHRGHLRSPWAFDVGLLRGSLCHRIGVGWCDLGHLSRGGLGGAGVRARLSFGGWVSVWVSEESQVVDGHVA